MPWWEVLLDVVVVLLVLLLILGVCLFVRRRLLSRDGGAFELSYRMRRSRIGRGWVLGLGRYTGDRLEWFRIFSLRPGPSQVWLRSELSYAGQRRGIGPEQMTLYADHVIVLLDRPSGELELAMTPSSLVGLQAWLEAGPPGTDWNRR